MKNLLRYALCFMLGVVLAFCIMPTPSKIGDVDGNGMVDVVDVLYVRAHIVGSHALTGREFGAADLDRNGLIDVADLEIVRNIIRNQ